MLGLKNVIQRLEGDLVNQGKALNQVSNKLILKCYYVSVVEGLKLELLLLNLKLTYWNLEHVGPTFSGQNREFWNSFGAKGN